MSEPLPVPGPDANQPVRGRATNPFTSIAIVVACLILVGYLLLTLLPLPLALLVAVVALLVIGGTALWIWRKESSGL